MALKLLKENSRMSISAIADKLSISHKQARAAIDKLKANGTIRFEGTGRGGYWIISE